MAKHNLWTAEEEEYLLSIMSHTHPLELGEELRKEALKNGWRLRSDCAVKAKTRILSPWAKPLDDNFSAATLSEILKLCPATVFQWIKLEKLKCEKVGKFFKITLKDIRGFARRHPSLLKYADYDGLVFLVGESLAEKIKAAPRLQGKKQKVRHIYTGQVFDSVTAAAKATNYSRSGLLRQIERRQNWERISS